MFIKFLTHRTHPILWLTCAYMVTIILAKNQPFLSAIFSTSGTNQMFYASKTSHQRVSIVGSIDSMQQHESMFGKAMIELSVLSTREILNDYQNPWKASSQKLLLYIDSYTNKKRQNNPTLDRSWQPGDIILIENISLKKPPNPSYLDYLKRDGLSASLFINSDMVKLIQRPQNSIKKSLERIRLKIYTRIKQKTNTQTFQLFSSIFLGNKNLPRDPFENEKTKFITWGVVHYLARSGLHLVLLIVAWVFFLSFIPISYSIKKICITFACYLYALLTWPSIAFNRALLSFIFYNACSIIRLRTNFLHILSMVTLITLLINPNHLFFLDFQLSFGLTFALAYLNQVKLDKKIKSPTYH